MKLTKRKYIAMILIVFAILLLLYLFSIFQKSKSTDNVNQVSQITESTDSGNQISKKTNPPDNVNNVYMKDSKNGWAILNDGSLISTKNDWKTYHQINKFIWNDQGASKSSLAYVDNKFFVIGFLPKNKYIGIYSSKDDGNTWNQSCLDYSDDDGGANQLFSSFTDSENGYILYCGEAAAGLMTKILYKTTDGGKTFQKTENLSYIKGYPTGMTFNRNGDGFISSIYHGIDNSFLYSSSDQGKTWNTIIIQQPSNINDTNSQVYINGYPPYFIGKCGFMILEYVKEQPSYRMYYSSDSGKTWHKDGTVNIKTDSIEFISNYSLSNKKTIYITDNNGKIMKKVKCGDRWN